MFSNLAVVACFAVPLLAQFASSEFVAKSVTRSGTIRLHGPIAELFPLFGPIREKDWAPGWNPGVLAPIGPDVAEGMVFTVNEPEGLTYWIVTHFDQASYAIAYANVTPDYVVDRIVITCRAAGSRETEVTVTYSHTGVSEAGNRFVERQTEAAYGAKMRHWEVAINHLLTTGKRIELH